MTNASVPAERLEALVEKWHAKISMMVDQRSYLHDRYGDIALYALRSSTSRMSRPAFRVSGGREAASRNQRGSTV